MYVEHFNHSDSGGGASIAAYRLVSTLNASALPVSSKLRVIQSPIVPLNQIHLLIGSFPHDLLVILERLFQTGGYALFHILQLALAITYQRKHINIVC